METLESQVREFLHRLLRAGFDTDTQLLQGVEDYLADDFKAEDVRREARRVLPLLKSELNREEAGWPEQTDNDRLRAAFARLQSLGVVVRENFTCCQTCGFAEIGDEVAKEEKVGRVVGFTFYHQQDTDAAVDGHGIALAYASRSGEDADSLRLGKMIAAVIQEEGLEVEWDETLARRIVVPMTWRRRRPAHLSQ